LNTQLPQLGCVDITWRLRHQVLPAVGFWKSDYVANGFRAANEHNQAIEPKSDSTVRRSAEAESAQQMTELAIGFLVR